MTASLDGHSDEGSTRLMELRRSLTNRQVNFENSGIIVISNSIRHRFSASREQNAMLQSDSLDDPLHVILRPDGSLSELFPPDLRTLFSYDGNLLSHFNLPSRADYISVCSADQAKKLVSDYGLEEHEFRERNLTCFMAHCGTSICKFIIDAPSSNYEAQALHFTRILRQ
jgi:hypothetical protein